MTRETVNDPLPLFGQLQVYCPPVEGESWQDQLGNFYQSDGGKHVTAGFITRESWDQFTKASKDEPFLALVLKLEMPVVRDAATGGHAGTAH